MPKIPAYKKAQLVGELRSLFGDNLKKDLVVTKTIKGKGTTVTFKWQDKEYSGRGRVPGKAYLQLLQNVRKTVLKDRFGGQTSEMQTAPVRKVQRCTLVSYLRPLASYA